LDNDYANISWDIITKGKLYEPKAQGEYLKWQQSVLDYSNQTTEDLIEGFVAWLDESN
jgi:hypothetical protein